MLEMDAQGEGYKPSKKDRRPSTEPRGIDLGTGLLLIATVLAGINYSRNNDAQQRVAHQPTPPLIVEPDRLPSHPDIHKVSSSAGVPAPFE